jgi:prepilin-type N-terminal cleavage/methylation domain-containing protein
MTRRGFTLIEVAVAVAVLGTAGLALQRLAVQVRHDQRDAARARRWSPRSSPKAALSPPRLRDLTDPDGIRTTRVVTRTAHPRLREVHVRSERADGRESSELVELVYAPAD